VSAGGEFDHIRWIRQHVSASNRLPVGIGDDTAILRFPSPADCLLTVDMLMEGVHFTLPPATPRQVGRKALGVNLSDIAAMAGKPLAAVVSVALPRNRGVDFARELHAGLQELAEQYHVVVAGGDTNSWDGPLVISVTLLGEATPNGGVLRSSAQVGDWIFVTGSLGGSLDGRHLTFQPRVNEALRLHETVELHSMIDLSDGLSSDLGHILDESQVGAVLLAETIPISDEALASKDDRSPLEHALNDGEDFELLFTVSPEDGRRLLAKPPLDLRISHIGAIVPELECTLIGADGASRTLPRSGWVHKL
jgi:thiamine-monophosphate kinase